MPLPDFIIPGGFKCGSTSLIKMIASHSQVHMAVASNKTTELHYFDKHYDKGIEWYKQQFKDGYCNGEKTPAYLASPKCIKRMAKDLAAIKLIVIIRNPTERWFSQMNWRRKQNYNKTWTNKKGESKPAPKDVKKPAPPSGESLPSTKEKEITKGVTKDMSQPTKPKTLTSLIISIVVVIAGTATGYGLSRVKAGSTGLSSLKSSQEITAESLKVGDVVGSADEETFRDKAEGVLVLG